MDFPAVIFGVNNYLTFIRSIATIAFMKVLFNVTLGSFIAVIALILLFYLIDLATKRKFPAIDSFLNILYGIFVTLVAINFIIGMLILIPSR
ncbi:MAG: hypothetical protein A3G03_02385 [Candidatus Taylorbacteria bacterium RIFCSPLOWO2_12_FULL_44_15c]|uniref:Uncharacterized protein n=1 Tax=Candidatus Taylorbacteria bacterium RIFCSPLOWO2_12_FULL_44_15c TaxID=1802333 RepID=A0A1G2P429_9BACT|nr:MAG: hypothetical protein A3G03_02385 [Candidatus Taylorbacteria bacterium RIFCSPLOWO2_12_FULL_44_15c]